MTEISNMSSEQIDSEIAATEAAIESAKPTKPTEDIFSNGSNDKLSAELGKIYDKAEAREERRPTIPPGKEGETLATAFDRTADFLALSKSEQRMQSDGAEALAETRKIAETYGLSLEEAEAFKQTELMRQNTEFGPAAEHLKSAFRESTPVESAKF